ncbi:unnamed protein product [Arctogadus glacialis]
MDVFGFAKFCRTLDIQANCKYDMSGCLTVGLRFALHHILFFKKEMLVQVECKGVLKWVRIPMKDDRYDYFQFIQEGVDVDADIFDELVRSAAVSFKVFTEDSAEKEVSEASFCSEEGSFSPIESVRSFSSVESVSSGSTVITECTKARRRQLVEGPPDSKAAKDMVYVALHQKTGGEDIFKEYNATKGLSDQTRRKLVNILVADMVESHGIIAVCKGLRPGTHVDDLLSAQEESNDYGGDEHGDIPGQIWISTALPPLCWRKEE